MHLVTLNIFFSWLFENEIIKTPNFSLTRMFEVSTLFNFEFVTDYFTYLLLKIRMLLKKRILYLSPIERKSWLFSTFSWSKKDGLLIRERCIFSFASRFITNWTTPLFLLSLATSMIEATAQWGQIVFITGKFEFLQHCNFTRFFLNFD